MLARVEETSILTLTRVQIVSCNTQHGQYLHTFTVQCIAALDNSNRVIFACILVYLGEALTHECKPTLNQYHTSYVASEDLQLLDISTYLLTCMCM